MRERRVLHLLSLRSHAPLSPLSQSPSQPLLSPQSASPFRSHSPSSHLTSPHLSPLTASHLTSHSPSSPLTQHPLSPLTASLPAQTHLRSSSPLEVLAGDGVAACALMCACVRTYVCVRACAWVRAYVNACARAHGLVIRRARARARACACACACAGARSRQVKHGLHATTLEGRAGRTSLTASSRH